MRTAETTRGHAGPTLTVTTYVLLVFDSLYMSFMVI
jgi:hypothetical protein